MYPYLLLIEVDESRFATRHRTYGEAIALKLELENRSVGRISITVHCQEWMPAIEW